jgi:hypothetical protein
MRRSFFCVLACLALGSGCSGKSTAGSGSSNVVSVSADDFVTAFVRATCDAIAACCASASFPFDRAACETSETREAQHILTDTNSLRVYDPAGAARCIDNARAVLSLCVTSNAIVDRMKHSCDEVYAGTVAVGGACQSEKDCAQGTQGPVECEIDALLAPMPTPMPICVVDNPGMVGEACLGSIMRDPTVHFPHLTCADGLYCDMTGHCQTSVAQGGACAHDECVKTAWCDGSTSTCAAQFPLGTACVSDLQCTSGACEGQLCSNGTPIAATGCTPPPPP